MAASIPSGMFFDTCCKAYAGIRAEHAQLTDVKLLLDAAKKTGEAYGTYLCSMRTYASPPCTEQDSHIWAH